MWPAITFLVWLIEATLWFATVALIVRPFGIRLPILWWHWREPALATAQALSRRQYVVVEGILKYGVGSWLLLSTANYIAGRLGDHSLFGEMKIGAYFFGIVGFMLMGMLVGLADWARGHRQCSTSPNQTFP